MRSTARKAARVRSISAARGEFHLDQQLTGGTVSEHEADDKRDGLDGVHGNDGVLPSGITKAQRIGIVEAALQAIETGAHLGATSTRMQEMGRDIAALGIGSNSLDRDQFASECLSAASVAGHIARSLLMLRRELQSHAKQALG